MKIGTMSLRPLRIFWIVVLLVICCTSHAIAQTAVNQPPALSAQGATFVKTHSL
jgi:hypothetical protein